MRKRATIRDVAAEAGCSAATVSRVLNGVGRTGAETRDRVLDAAHRLGFAFDPIGRSLQSRRSRTLGVVVPSLSNPVFGDAVEGVQAVVRRRGYQLLLACSDYDRAAEGDAVATLTAQRVEGLILTVSDAAESAGLDRARAAGLPFVLIFNHPASGTPAVAFDNRAAAGQVAAEMLALGHRHAAFVAGRFRSSDRSKQRFEGFCAAYAAAGAPRPSLVEVDYTARNHRAAVATLLAERREVSALFCSNDMLALQVIGELRRLGRHVPEDLSVAGFDGIDVAALTEPSVATIATPCLRMGREAAERLIDAIESGTEPEGAPLLLPHEFRPGRSLARARTGIAEPGAATPDPAPIPVVTTVTD